VFDDSCLMLQVIMSLVAAGLMDKAGRRILLMVSAGGMALSSFLVGLSFYLRVRLLTFLPCCDDLASL
jgi:SP family sugar porter-like MFS transporter